MIAGKQSCWLGIQKVFMDGRDKMDPSYMIQRDSALSAQCPDPQQTVTFISDNGEHLALFYVRGT